MSDALDLFTHGIQRVVREGHKIEHIEVEELDGEPDNLMAYASDANDTTLVAVKIPRVDGCTPSDVEFGLCLLASIASAEPLSYRRATV